MENIIFKIILERPLLFTAPYGFMEESLTRLHLSALQKTKKSSEFLYKVRNKKLRLLFEAASHIPFWKERIGNKLLNTKEPLSWLRSLPITTKPDLRNTPIRDRTNWDIAAKYGILTATSGSTGEPLQFFIDKRLKVRLWALLARVGGLQGFSQRSLIHLWPTFNPNPLFSGHFFSVKTVEELRHQRIDIYKLSSRGKAILQGLPSLLRLLLEFADKDGIALRPLIVLTSGEELTQEMRLFFQERFQCRVVSYYGSRELSVMAGQCDLGRFHENSEDVIFEVVSEDGFSLEPGEVGRIIVTGLNSYIAPFIRYHLGDYGFFYGDLCPCGNSFPSFNFEGRTHDTTPIILSDGSQIFPYRLTGIFNRRFEKIRQYQIDHYAPNSFLIRVIPAEVFNENDKMELVRELKQITRNSKVDLRSVKFIDSRGSKILPYIKSF